MAVLYAAELRPGKLELLTAWLATQPWAGDATWQQVATFRFDDPDGEVGMETFILKDQNDRHVVAPLTYRGAPLEGAEASLITTMEHSVLGDRWVYDACADPVYACALLNTIASGGTEADQFVDEGEKLRKIDNTGRVQGSGLSASLNVAGFDALPTVRTDGDVTTIQYGGHELKLLRRIDAGELAPAEGTLGLTWNGRSEPVIIATASPLQT